VHPQATGEKYTVTFLQYFSQSGRRKVHRVPISPEDLRASFLAYITGRLPDSDRARFEEQLLEDQDFSDAAALCEQQLIDDYALRRLLPEETRAVGLWIEASPDRVERVTFARALLQTAPRRSRRHSIDVVLAVAACLLVAATLVQMTARLLHRKQQTTQLVSNNTPPQTKIPPAATASGAAIKPDIILLAAERTRGEQTITTYQVHRESPLELQIVLPGETARSAFQVRLATATDPTKTLLQQSNLEAHSMASQLYLTVALPPGSLQPATYTVSVTRQDDTLLSTFTLKWIPE
jgi:anti-sigma-K factor RskA